MRAGTIIIIATIALGLLVWWMSSQFPNTLDNEFAFRDLVYSIALLALVGPATLYHFKGNAGGAVKSVLIWIALFAACFVLYAMRDAFDPMLAKIKGELNPSAAHNGAQGEVTLMRAEDGHFYADAFVNGSNIRFMVDTGASRVALSRSDAARIGINLDDLHYNSPTYTANGMVMVAPVRLNSVSVGSLVVNDVRASVARDGTMDGSLLGMSFLEGLSGYMVKGDELILWQ